MRTTEPLPAPALSGLPRPLLVALSSTWGALQMAPGDESKWRRGSALNKGTPGSGPAKSIDWVFPTPAAASVPEKGRHRNLGAPRRSWAGGPPRENKN
ncbi:hypothetical protein MRX96_037766 [Rhipicephalus microplus]